MFLFELSLSVHEYLTPCLDSLGARLADFHSIKMQISVGGAGIS